jgi:hypothetical protein
MMGFRVYRVSCAVNTALEECGLGFTSSRLGSQAIRMMGFRVYRVSCAVNTALEECGLGFTSSRLGSQAIRMMGFRVYRVSCAVNTALESEHGQTTEFLLRDSSLQLTNPSPHTLSIISEVHGRRVDGREFGL